MPHSCPLKKWCGVWGLYLIFASLCSISSNIEGLSVDHASEFVSLTDLAVKSITTISIFSKERLYNLQKKTTWNWKSFNINFNCTVDYFSLILFFFTNIDNTNNVILHRRQTDIMKLNQTDCNLNFHSFNTIIELHQNLKAYL